MILLVASNKDAASLNIKEQILATTTNRATSDRFQGNTAYEIELANENVRLVTLEEEAVYAQNIADSFPNAELVVFTSRHSSLSGTPTLSVHAPGNIGEAKLGGLPRTVSVSPANAMREALRTMTKWKNEMQLDYEVCYEGTHHGPCLNVPTMFAELGSSPKQWKDTRAAEVVAHAALEALSGFRKPSVRAVLGIGGPHYNSKFTKAALEGDMAFGHIIPKYAVSNVDSLVLEQCVKRTLEKVEAAVLDWKGIKGEDKPKVLGLIENIRIEAERI